MNMSFVWEDNFPKGYGHTSIAFLKRCYGFEDAKNGDLNAAHFVANRCIKQDRLCELREKYPDAIVLPVICKNKLPLALAQAIGLPVWYDVHLLPTVPRKFLCAIQRLLLKPTFIGAIHSDLDYILVDDIITQGGTIAELRKYVLINGGNVVAVVALAYAIGSHDVAPSKKHVVRLLVKFGETIIFLLKMFGIVEYVQELTNSQVKYLLKFASIRNIEKNVYKFNLFIDEYNSLPSRNFLLSS